MRPLPIGSVLLQHLAHLHARVGAKLAAAAGGVAVADDDNGGSHAACVSRRQRARAPPLEQNQSMVLIFKQNI